MKNSRRDSKQQNVSDLESSMNYEPPSTQNPTQQAEPIFLSAKALYCSHSLRYCLLAVARLASV